MRRRGSLRLAAPLAVIAVGLLALGIWLAFGGSQFAEGSWSEGSWSQGSPEQVAAGVTANIPGWEESPSDAGTSSTTSSVTTVPASAPDTTVPAPKAVSTTTSTVHVNPIEDPARIQIPSLSIDVELISVGIQKNGDMELPPYGFAAWYKLGPKPGAAGPAVIIGHLDSKKGRDVFYRLKNIEIGQTVLVYDRGGSVATFVVDGKEQQLKTALPVDRIWNNTEMPVLRLITCGGRFDRSTGHYLSNTIVYAHLFD